MNAAISIRRVHLHEWREVRDLRLAAVADAAASIAFLTSEAEERARDDAFWRERTAGAALGENAAQFVAIAREDEADGDADEWIGTATVLLREAGSHDHLGHTLDGRRADVVGVYVAPEYRGRGAVEGLFAAAAQWATAQGHDGLTLDVHADNARAQAAYRRLGFVPTGASFTSSIGPEIEMRHLLTSHTH